MRRKIYGSLRISSRCLICMVVVSIIVCPAHALGKNDVEKAKDFMKAGMYPQAIKLLNKRINEEPLDTEAHFQLGMCFMTTNQYPEANERFRSVARLMPEYVKHNYGTQIGTEYEKVGLSALDQGRIKDAESFFRNAVKYNPNLKKNIAGKCLSQGNTYRASQLFQFEVALDEKPGLRYPAWKDYLEAASNARILLSLAEDFDSSLKSQVDKIDRDYGIELIEKGNSLKDIKKRERYIDEGIIYTDWETVFDAHVKYFTGLWGEPKTIMLDSPTRLRQPLTINRKTVLHILSLEDFNIAFGSIPKEQLVGRHSINIWPILADVNIIGPLEITWASIPSCPCKDEQSCEFFLNMDKKPTKVYWWEQVETGY